MKLKNLSISLTQQVNRHIAVRWAILVLVTAIFIVTLYPNLFVKKQTYQLGDVADRDIKAPKDFFIEDKTATEENRREAAEGVLTVYDLDGSLLSRLETDISGAFEALRSTMNRERELQKLVSAEKWDSTTVADSENRPSMHENIWGQKEDFEKQIGISISAGAYRILEEESFSAEIADVLGHILTQILSNGVVANREVLLREFEKGIVLRDVETQTERTIRDLKRFYGLDQAKTIVRIVVAPLTNELSYNVRNLIIDFAQEFIQPNITLNRNETAERRKKAVAEIKPVLSHIKAGEMILREGERVNLVQLLKLQRLQEQISAREAVIESLGAAAIMICLLLTMYILDTTRRPAKPDQNKHLLTTAIVFVIMLLIARISPALSETLTSNLTFHIGPASLYYAVPLASGAITICLLLGLDMAVGFAIASSAAVAIIFQNRFDLFMYFLISSIMGAYWIRDCRERVAFIKAGLKIGCLNIALVMAINAYQADISGGMLFWDGAFALAGGIGAGMVSMAIVPLFEIIFGYATDIKLLELANLDRPILRRLMIEAPGTYHHSVIVGSLVEAAATEIGANPLMAKVCGYYHDIGKIKKPLYFIENQTNGRNKHDKLAPSMSKRILVAHIKDGVTMARQNGLGQPIIDTIIQHHGTSLIRYFFERARQLTGEKNVKSEDYRYPGPLPQTREAGLAMLADVVEAASRALDNPTPARIQGLVQDLINKVFSDGQLDHCELTLKDLHNIAKSFNKILNGIHHHRIEYPDQAAASNGKSKNGHSYRQPSNKVHALAKQDPQNGTSRLRRLGIT